MARPSGRDLRTEIIREASVAIQTEGTAFSYQQLADRLGVRAPSLHHHFQRKDELIDAATSAYIDAFEQAVAQMPDGTATERLNGYIEIFSGPSREGRFCLCGALSADWEQAPPPVRKRISTFFEQQVGWVINAISAGVEQGEFRADFNVAEFGRGFVAALEGALLMARASPNQQPAAGPRELLRLIAA